MTSGTASEVKTTKRMPVYCEETGALLYEIDWFTRSVRPQARKKSAKRARRDAPVRDEVARLHKRASVRHTQDKCYFIGGESGPVKIGYSINVANRLRRLQLTSPIPLALLAEVSGGARREMAYHVQFAEHRIHGEWFNRHPDILAEIARLSEQVQS